jgi:hypothetical protein
MVNYDLIVAAGLSFLVGCTSGCTTVEENPNQAAINRGSRTLDELGGYDTISPPVNEYSGKPSIPLLRSDVAPEAPSPGY